MFQFYPVNMHLLDKAYQLPYTCENYKLEKKPIYFCKNMIRAVCLLCLLPRAIFVVCLQLPNTVYDKRSYFCTPQTDSYHSNAIYHTIVTDLFILYCIHVKQLERVPSCSCLTLFVFLPQLWSGEIRFFKIPPPKKIFMGAY